MAVRKIKPFPTYSVSGWLIEKRSNSFAGRLVYEAIALTPDGYQAAKHGFQIKREAYAFAANTVAPTAR